MRNLFLLTLFTAGLFYFGGCSMAEDTVAKVGDTQITAAAFKQSLSRRFSEKESYADVDSATKMNVLNSMILRELKALAARDLGLHKDDKFVAEGKMQKARILGNKYFEKVIVDKLLPEDELRADYDMQKEQIKASHILLGFKGAQQSKATRTKQEAQALATELKTRANNGEDFGAMAEKYSDDPSAKKNKGDLGFFTWGRMVGAFQETAFQMNPGEISDLVETPFGFHIIKLVEKQDNPNYSAENFEKEKYNIKRRMYFTKKDSGMAMWKRHSDGLRDKYGFEMTEENINKVVEAANESPKKATADDYSDEVKQLVLANWSGGQITANDIFAFYGKRFNTLAPKLTNLSTFTTEVENGSLQDLIILDAEKIGVADEPDIRSQILESENGKLAGMVETKEVKEKAEVTEEESRAYFDEHPDEFVRPAELDMWEVFVKDEKLANTILKKAKAGSSFENLASKYSEDSYYKKKKGHVGYKQEKHRGEVSKAAFKLGPNKIGGPVKYRNGWAIIKTGELKEKSQRNYEEVKAQVQNKVKNAKINKLRTEWEADLRDRYSVKINLDLVDQI